MSDQTDPATPPGTTPEDEPDLRLSSDPDPDPDADTSPERPAGLGSPQEHPDPPVAGS